MVRCQQVCKLNIFCFLGTLFMRLNQPYFGEQWFDKLLFCVSWVIWIMVELLSLWKAVKQRDHLEKMKCKLIPWMFFFGFRLNVCVNLSLCIRTGKAVNMLCFLCKVNCFFFWICQHLFLTVLQLCVYLLLLKVIMLKWYFH